MPQLYATAVGLGENEPNCPQSSSANYGPHRLLSLAHERARRTCEAKTSPFGTVDKRACIPVSQCKRLLAIDVLVGEEAHPRDLRMCIKSRQIHKQIDIVVFKQRLEGPERGAAEFRGKNFGAVGVQIEDAAEIKFRIRVDVRRIYGRDPSATDDPYPQFGSWIV